jgi:hypothetical protein
MPTRTSIKTWSASAKRMPSRWILSGILIGTSQLKCQSLFVPGYKLSTYYPHLYSKTLESSLAQLNTEHCDIVVSSLGLDASNIMHWTNTHPAALTRRSSSCRGYKMRKWRASWCGTSCCKPLNSAICLVSDTFILATRT